MVLSRAAALPKGLARTVLRRAGSSTRNRSWRQIGQRGYASEHGHRQSSEIPWIIGSLAVTIPAAGWLLQQGPTTSDHGHGHGHHDEKHAEEKEEEQSDEGESKEESTDESKDAGKDEGGDGEKDEDKGGEEADSDKSDDSGKSGDDTEEGDDKESGGDSKSKGSSSGQKTETKGEKDAQGDSSGAKHPYLDDPEKSKKGAGTVETARIHGTVDSKGGARGVGKTGDSAE